MKSEHKLLLVILPLLLATIILRCPYFHLFLCEKGVSLPCTNTHRHTVSSFFGTSTEMKSSSCYEMMDEMIYEMWCGNIIDWLYKILNHIEINILILLTDLVCYGTSSSSMTQYNCCHINVRTVKGCPIDMHRQSFMLTPEIQARKVVRKL